MIEIRRKLIVRREVWFDEPWKDAGADLIVFYHWSQPLNPKAAQEVHSLEIDLTRDESAIWKGFTATARNLINRGTKESLSFQAWTVPPPAVVDEFFAFRKQFAAERGMSAADPSWMYAYAAQGALILTRACAPDGKPLVWHSYSRAPGWVRLLHSVSLNDSNAEERKWIGWANRYLHWMDLLECRKLAIERYDFGGWYAGTEDEKLLRINAFKEQFGGVKTKRYHSMLPGSAKGKLFLMARERLKGQHGLVHYV